MTPNFESYHDYINHLICHYNDNISFFNFSLLDDRFQSALFKMIFLDVDSVISLLKPLYSHTGRPAKNQIAILRSFILMAHYRCLSIPKWVDIISKNKCLAILCGFKPDDISSFSSHYDFISRIYLGQKRHREDFILSEKPYKSKELKKPGKGQKWDNHKPSATNELYETLLSNEDQTCNLSERILLRLFSSLAVSFSHSHGMIDNHIVISGDGTAIHTHADGRGTRIDETSRRFSDLDATIGWDSDLNCFYYGYTGYSISYINHKYNIDLPLFLTIAKASQHDALTSMTALAQFCSIENSISFSHYCLDSASDNTATHKLCYSLGILPVIDINKRMTGKNIYEPHKGISENGRPICIAGKECIRDGFDRSRMRHKFRCPLAQRKINDCPLKNQCSSSDYGRTFHIKSKDDLRLFGVVPYKSEEWKTIYKDRTSCERINNRILNDYKFKDCFMHGESRTFFMLIMIGINIHLDAYYKITSL